MMGLFPLWVSKSYLSVRHRNTQSSILRTDIQYYDVTTDSLCKILLDTVVLKRSFEACSLYKSQIVYMCACMWRVLVSIMVQNYIPLLSNVRVFVPQSLRGLSKAVRLACLPDSILVFVSTSKSGWEWAVGNQGIWVDKSNLCLFLDILNPVWFCW